MNRCCTDGGKEAPIIGAERATKGTSGWIDKPRVNDLHPTMKPIALVERAIDNSSRKGNVVLDPFAGSGTTAIACERLGRHACLVEIDPCYADVIVRRWEGYTGRGAELVGDGCSFEQVQQERLTRKAA